MSSSNGTTAVATTMSSSDSASSAADSPTSAVATSPSASSASPTSIDTSSIASAVSSAISSELLSSTSTPPPQTTSSSQAPTSTPPTSAAPPATTTTFSASTRPPTTELRTSVVFITPTGGEAPSSVVVTVTADIPGTTQSASVGTISHSSSTTSGGAALNTGGSGSGSGSGGLSTAGVTAIAVVVPVAAVALLVLAGIFLWRKRKQKKAAEEARRKEVEDYGFNPNNDPTLPTVASESGHEMSEDHSNGYRGWGAATSSNRKMSTTLSGGHTQGQLSDVGSSAYHAGPNSPTHGSDGHSGDPLVNSGRRETLSTDDIGALGQAPIAGSMMNQGMKRGPSNASSTYSVGGAPSETSDGIPPNGLSQSYEAYNPNTGFGYSQHGPYGDGTYGGAADGGMPVVRDVSARRNTRIQQPGNYQQGNSGISQNF